MTNPNVTRWIGSVERLKLQKQSERPFHQDEQQFYLFHPPMPTENWKQLQQFFDERTEIENEKTRLKEDERKLVDKFDGLNKALKKTQEKQENSADGAIVQRAEIDSIQKEIQKVTEELIKVRKEMKEKDEEIDRINEKINEQIEIVIEDEDKLVQEQQVVEKEKNDKRMESLIAQL